MLRIVIIEDELNVGNLIKAMLLSCPIETTVIGVLKSISDMKSFFESSPSVDLILTDIRLGDGNVFDAFDELEIQSNIVFITSFDEYAIRSFKYNAIDYIFKTTHSGIP